MCGIIGYTGPLWCRDILINGLDKLAYRGYDSAGIAILEEQEIHVKKAQGKLEVLKQLLEKEPIDGHVGIGHTRWATHGEPSYVNSHPQLDQSGRIALVHNGIIENYHYLKQMLLEKGVNFVSETDTEVVAQLLGYYYQGDMLATIFQVIPMLEGSFALAILCQDSPNRVYCLRKDSPLIVGTSEGKGQFIASDVPAILEYTRDVYYLENYEVAVLEPEHISFYDKAGNACQKQASHVDWDVEAAQKGGFEHFMIKEIHEQPQVLNDTFHHYVAENSVIRAEAMPLDIAMVQSLKKLDIIACGTAYHAGVVGKYLMEEIARLPVNVDIASEFRYRNPIIQPGDVYIVVSQSGETADTIAAMRLVQQQGGKVIAICNVVGSTIAREADYVLFTYAGPEIAVASTKAYMTQLMVFYLFGLDIAAKKGLLAAERLKELLTEMSVIPAKIEKILAEKAKVQYFASREFQSNHIFYIGRGMDYALTMEAALKMKEVSYIPSEAYAAGELKHGTIALIEKGTLVVAMATQKSLLEKMASNIKEVVVRGASVLSLTNGHADIIACESEKVWELPEIDPLLAPFLCIVPMQLFAYYMAVERGCDVDKPRNLAKSVTVE